MPLLHPFLPPFVSLRARSSARSPPLTLSLSSTTASPSAITRYAPTLPCFPLAFSPITWRTLTSSFLPRSPFLSPGTRPLEQINDGMSLEMQ